MTNRPAPSWYAEIDALPQYTMREACRWCGEVSRGRIREVNGQTSILCAACRRGVYVAPKSETGKPQGRTRPRPDLPFGLREKILEADRHRCLMCGRDPITTIGLVLDVAHVGSYADPKKQGATDEEIFSEHNLFSCCANCNQDRVPASASLHPSLILRIIRARMVRNG